MRLPGGPATLGEVPSLVTGVALGVPGLTLWRAGPMTYASTIRACAIGCWTFSRIMLPEAAMVEGISKGLLICRLPRGSLHTTLNPLV